MRPAVVEEEVPIADYTDHQDKVNDNNTNAVNTATEDNSHSTDEGFYSANEEFFEEELLGNSSKTDYEQLISAIPEISQLVEKIWEELHRDLKDSEFDKFHPGSLRVFIILVICVLFFL